MVNKRKLRVGLYAILLIVAALGIYGSIQDLQLTMYTNGVMNYESALFDANPSEQTRQAAYAAIECVANMINQTGKQVIAQAPPYLQCSAYTGPGRTDCPAYPDGGEFCVTEYSSAVWQLERGVLFWAIVFAVIVTAELLYRRRKQGAQEKKVMGSKVSLT